MPTKQRRILRGRKQALRLIKRLGEGKWTIRRTRVAGSDGTVSGNTELQETYCLNGEPALVLCIEAGRGRCVAYDLRKVQR